MTPTGLVATDLPRAPACAAGGEHGQLAGVALLAGLRCVAGDDGPLWALSAVPFVPLTAVSAVTRRRHLRTRRGR